MCPYSAKRVRSLACLNTGARIDLVAWPSLFKSPSSLSFNAVAWQFILTLARAAYPAKQLFQHHAMSRQLKGAGFFSRPSPSEQA